MFDANDIATSARKRAIEIKAERARRSKRRAVAIITSLCCVICAVAVITASLSRGQDEEGWILIPENKVPLAALLAPDENAEPYDTGQPRAGPTVQIPQYEDIKGSNDSQKAKAELINPEDNPCWFQFEIILAESRETIYKSDLVAPAKCIREVTLDRTLETGEHEVELVIRSYELETYHLMNLVSVKLNLQVE